MKSFCIVCGNEIDENKNECKCGCKRMINGDNFIFTNQGINCKCGNSKFKLGSSYNCTDHHITVYRCDICSNNITVYTYKDEDEMCY